MSVVIPAWNESADIAGCIECIGAQDFPLSRIEVIVADGASDDRTVEMSLAAAARFPFRSVLVVENPERRTSAGLNRALAAATGEYVVRVDARSRVQPSYVRRCVDVLARRPDIGVVGGAQQATARSAAPWDAAIARALRNRWTTGMSRYRRATESGPSDTVWMGAFRAEDLRRLGGWNEAVALNEDFELNERFRTSGKLVWFESSLRSTYLPRATVWQLSQQYFAFGRVKGTWWARGARLGPRHAALLAVAGTSAAGGAVLMRRKGAASVAIVAIGGLVTVELAGGHETVPFEVRIRAAGLHGVVVGSWLGGVVAGLVGEQFGIRHRHG